MSESLMVRRVALLLACASTAAVASSLLAGEGENEPCWKEFERSCAGIKVNSTRICVETVNGTGGIPTTISHSCPDYLLSADQNYKEVSLAGAGQSGHRGKQGSPSVSIYVEWHKCSKANNTGVCLSDGVTWVYCDGHEENPATATCVGVANP